MKRKFWITLSSCIVVVVLVGITSVLGLFGSGDSVQAAGTPRLSIPAAAFTPWRNGATYENHGRFLKHLAPGIVGNLPANLWYIAPLYLPDGVTLTKIIAHWYQQNPNDLGQLKVQRTKFGSGNFQDLVVVDSGTTDLFGSTFTTTINPAVAVVDNSQYAYWLLFYLPASAGTTGVGDKNVWGCGAQIEFTFPIFMPLISN